MTKPDASYTFEKDLIGIGACLQNIQLAASEREYGSCIIGELYGRQNELSDHIKPDFKDYFLVCGIVLGKTKYIPGEPRKRQLSDFILNGIL